MSRFPASGGGGSAYTYVQSGYPGDATEGESLYHVGEDRAYVYTGTDWVEQTVVDHSDLSGIGSGDHHSRYTASEARSATDGQIDADTVDGNHASDLGRSFSRDSGGMYYSDSGGQFVDSGTDYLYPGSILSGAYVTLDMLVSSGADVYVDIVAEGNGGASSSQTVEYHTGDADTQHSASWNLSASQFEIQAQELDRVRIDWNYDIGDDDYPRDMNIDLSWWAGGL